MKTGKKISGYIARSAAVAVLLSSAIVGFTSAFNLPGRWSRPALSASLVPQARTLSFGDRVAYHRAIEEVYWRHRIWPKENSKPKPPLDAVMSRTEIEKKVEDYLRNSQALGDYWQRPITPDQLQAEIERMAQHTKKPEVLREVFAALGNDPFVIAECLARPALAERLVRNLYAHDERFHGELKRRAEADLAAHASVKQMKQTSGAYSETEWMKSDEAQEKVAHASRLRAGKSAGGRLRQATARQGAPALQEPDAPNAIKLDSTEWQQNVDKLAGSFGVRSRPRGIAGFESSPRRVRPVADADASAQSKNADSYKALPVGKLSSLQEDDSAYYATAVLNKAKGRLKVATVDWRKEPLKSWLAKAETEAPLTMAAVNHGYTLPSMENPSGSCTDDTWSATFAGVPDGRELHTAVWTGSEMIVWGGVSSSSYLNSGGRYDPATDSWTATSITNAPAARFLHTAVWTGTRMIVWGGYSASDLNTGGRYDPATDSWTATSTTNAPAGRDSHSAVWTGSRMIVWGGSSLNTGGRYDPATDSWLATSTTNAPAGRDSHTAVWTGSEMIVWGGGSFPSLNTGGRYDPATDSWTATSTTNGPKARYSHSAV